jgi:Inositol hexakisphosphate
MPACSVTILLSTPSVRTRVHSPCGAGINTARVEEMEGRLKRDILAEAARCDGQVLVTDEGDDLSVFDLLVQAPEADVQTPKEVFEELRADGYNVQYRRIPITDEKVFAGVASFLSAIPQDV